MRGLLFWAEPWGLADGRALSPLMVRGIEWGGFGGTLVEKQDGCVRQRTDGEGEGE